MSIPHFHEGRPVILSNISFVLGLGGHFYQVGTPDTVLKILQSGNICLTSRLGKQEQLVLNAKILQGVKNLLFVKYTMGIKAQPRCVAQGEAEQKMAAGFNYPGNLFKSLYASLCIQNVSIASQPNVFNYTHTAQEFNSVFFKWQLHNRGAHAGEAWQ